jgi:flagellar biosynthesis GTPase FlhF
MTKENNYRTGEVTQLRRIADALEEILRLVKQDQEASAARQRQNDNE